MSIPFDTSRTYPLSHHAFVNPRVADLTQYRLGRILNRFTYDVEVLDIELSVSMAGLMISSSWLVAAIIVMVRKIVCFAECSLCRDLDLDTMINLCSIVIIAIFQSSILPWIILGLVPVSVIYFFIQLYYRMSGPDLQRIDAMSRSPIQASLAEGKYILICFQLAKVFPLTPCLTCCCFICT
jgi:ABC-type multidrug transport system fused ATPase/permease subunit